MYWKEEYNLGIVEIDNQHKKLLELINRLYDAFVKKDQDTEVGHVIEELYDYIKYHFRVEEEYFEVFAYEHAKSHELEHKHFVNKVDEFRKKHDVHGGSQVFTIILFLQDWIINHILKSDVKYVELFKKNNVI